MSDPRYIDDPFAPSASNDQQAISNPFEAQSSGQQAIDNPFEESAPQANVGVLRNKQRGAMAWMNDLENDIRTGSQATWVGALLNRLGARGTDSGVSSGAADTVASPVLGTVKAMKGAAELGNSSYRSQGLKDIGGGIIQAATIPSAFVAPEGAEVVSEGLDTAANAVVEPASKVKAAFWVPSDLKAAAAEVPDAETVANAARSASEIKTAAAQALHDALHSELNDVADEVGVDVSGVSHASTKAARIGSSLQQQAQAIYQKADEAAEQITGQPGRFQDLTENIDAIRDDLRFERDPEVKAKLSSALNDALNGYEAYKQQLQQAGLDLSSIKSADKLWSKGASYREIATALGRSERLNGDIIPSTNPLDSNIRRLSVEGQQRGHVLLNALGEDRAQRIVDAVKQAGEQVANNTAATRQAKNAVRDITRRANAAQQRIAKIRGNQWKAATATGAIGGGTAALLKVLGGSDR